MLQVNLKAHKSTANLDTQQFMKALSLEQFAWINTHYSINRYEALVGDAGFRQYFRLYTTEKTYIFYGFQRGILYLSGIYSTNT
ncbi:MAG: hypothetical protein LRY43_01330 [Gammaproteobacteria bacterium]|nr:hypothetical protein [Gammaproteobacteria bacterium]